jgi:membrane protein DedA with SNARE-associated domain
MFFSLNQVISWLLVYKYFVLFPFVVIEGPIVTIISGLLSSVNLLNIFIVYPVIVVADLTGDFIYYSIGRWGREGFLAKYGKYFGLKKENIQRVENHFEKHTRKTLVIGKISHAFGAPILVAAGIANVKILDFFLFNLIATIPKSLFFLLLGYYFGQAYVKLNKYLNYVSIGILVIAILVIIGFYVYKRMKRKFDKMIDKIDKSEILGV